MRKFTLAAAAATAILGGSLHAETLGILSVSACNDPPKIAVAAAAARVNLRIISSLILLRFIFVLHQ